MTEQKETTLTGLMGILMAYTEKAPVYLYMVTTPHCRKTSRADDALPLKERKRNPYLAPDHELTLLNERGEPALLIEKHCKILAYVNSNYEEDVQKRQERDRKMLGERGPVPEEDQFIASEPAWGAKLPASFAVEGETTPPKMIEWWVPKYTTRVKFYLAMKPVQCQQVWYQWALGPKAGQKLTDIETADFVQNYADEKDDEMDAMRQGVDKPIQWRKPALDSIRELTIASIRYVVVDFTMPEVPPSEREALETMLSKAQHERKEYDEVLRKRREKALRKAFPDTAMVPQEETK